MLMLPSIHAQRNTCPDPAWDGWLVWVVFLIDDMANDYYEVSEDMYFISKG